MARTSGSQALPGNPLKARLCLARPWQASEAEPREKCVPRRSLGTRLASLLLRVSREGFGDLAFFLVTLVEDDAVAERKGVALFHRVVAALFAIREIVQAPGVGREQAVGADVPVGRIAEARGVIED